MMVDEQLASAGNRDDEALALMGARLVDGSGRRPVERSVVVVSHGKFLNTGPESLVQVPTDARRVEVSGKTIIPGLIDSHVHLGQLYHNRFGVAEPEQLMDDFLALFCSKGVTTVRCTGSPDLAASFRRLKDSEPHWPRFFGSGPNLDGTPGGPYPGLRVITSPDEAVHNVEDLIVNGADFIKIYAWMRPPEIKAVVAAAHRHGKRVAAHVGHVVTTRQAVALGVDCLEHTRMGPELLTDLQRSHLAQLPARRHDALATFRHWRYVDPGSVPALRLIDEFADAAVFIVPTLTLSRSALRSRLEKAVRHPPGSELMHPAVLSRWQETEIAADYSQSDLAFAPLEFSRQLEFIGYAHGSGVRIVAGTDVPNPFIVPGFSLHEELRLLVSAGLSPLEAITAATRRAAELLGVEDELGSIEGGKRADLVVVDGDPTVDITATTRVVAVMKDGRWVKEPETKKWRA